MGQALKPAAPGLMSRYPGQMLLSWPQEEAVRSPWQKHATSTPSPTSGRNGISTGALHAGIYTKIHEIELLAIHVFNWVLLITVRNKVAARQCFYTRLSFCPGGGPCRGGDPSMHWSRHHPQQATPGRHPPGQTPSLAGTNPPWQAPPWVDTHPLAGTRPSQGRHPPPWTDPPSPLAGQTVTAADGTHPTGMHSYFGFSTWWIHLISCIRQALHQKQSLPFFWTVSFSYITICGQCIFIFDLDLIFDEPSKDLVVW